MKTRARNLIVALALLALSALNVQLSTAFAQGSLTPPPGVPGPTMLTLNQMEPRTPISAPVTITQPGSYYLTTNITVASGDAIDISANGVTLDLKGFTISTTGSGSYGIFLELGEGSGNTDITICNGHIVGAFYGGIYHNNTGGTPHNVRVTGVTVSGCGYYGIDLETGNSTVVESCPVNNVGGYGIVASSVSHSTAIQCGNTAIAADTASDCSAYSTGGEGLVAAYAANNCYGNSDSFGGIYVFNGNAINCYGNSNGGVQGLYAAGSAENCYGYSSSGIGLDAGGNAENCYGSSGSGTGISVDQGNAINCYGNSYGGGYGLFAAGGATGCYGTSSGPGDGLIAFTANNCFGYCTGAGFGIYAFTANNCYAASTTGIGLDVSAGVATGCYGTSSGPGDGLDATAANNCYGYCLGTGDGLNVSQTASGCYGYSGGNGNGVQAGVANTCSGYANGSGSGIIASSAYNCNGSSTNGFGLYVTNNAENCYGNSINGSDISGGGIYVADGNANNCDGNTAGGTGLYVALGNANNCIGVSASSIYFGLDVTQGSAIGCLGSDSKHYGISAFIAIGCFSVNGDSFITHPYNMP